MEKKINKTNILKHLPMLIYLINLNKIIIGFQLSRVNEIYDPDLISYYEPVSKNFLDTYFGVRPQFTYLSAQVTPFFPIFLKISGNRSVGLFIYALLSILILVLTYKICLKLFTKKVAIITIFILSIEPSFYASSLNLAPELLFAFTMVLTTYLIICKPYKKIYFNYTISFFIIGLSVLIRPIALVLIIAILLFWVASYIRDKDNLKIVYALITILPSLFWSFRNYIVHGFFNVSSISAHNLLWYEGVPALAESTGITFEEAGAIESNLRDQYLGRNAGVLELYDYDRKRGIELVLDHPIGMVIAHLKGAAKLVFGVYKSKYEIIINNVYNIENQIYYKFVYACLGIIILSIWLLFFYGLKPAFRQNYMASNLMLFMIILILIPASGQVAYARFRAPISPLLLVFAGYGLQECFKGNLLFFETLKTKILRVFKVKKETIKF